MWFWGWGAVDLGEHRLSKFPGASQLEGAVLGLVDDDPIDTFCEIVFQVEWTIIIQGSSQGRVRLEMAAPGVLFQP